MDAIVCKIVAMQVLSSKFVKEDFNAQGSMKIGNTFTFDVNMEGKQLLCKHNIILKSDDMAFADVTLQSAFALSEDSFNSLKKNNKIKFPRDFLVQCGSISYGALRGIILQEGLHKGFDNIIIPPLIIHNIITHSVILDIK